MHFFGARFVLFALCCALFATGLWGCAKPAATRVASRGSSATSPARPNLCRGQERALFTCTLIPRGSKKTRPGAAPLLQSVCVSPDFARGKGRIAYRLGNRRMVDVDFPASSAGSHARFQWQTIGYSGGWDTRIQFWDGARRFQVFERAIKTSIRSKALTGGVLIYHHMRGPKAAAARTEKLNCTSASVAPIYSNTLNDLFGLIPTGKFFRDE